jgi:hypothetical protein
MIKWTKFSFKFKDYIEQNRPNDNTVLKEYDECITQKKNYENYFNFDYATMEKEFPICSKNIISSFSILFS